MPTKANSRTNTNTPRTHDAAKLLDDVAIKNRKWLSELPLIVDPETDNTAPVMVRLNIDPIILGSAFAIAMRRSKTVEQVLSACLNNGADALELASNSTNDEALSKIGL